IEVLYVTFAFPSAPLFVVIKITPFAALEPYIADADPSFNTSKDAISAGLMLASGLEAFTADLSELTTGTPSITISGPAPAVREFTPRIRIMGAAPKIPLGVVIDTPGARPAS